MVSLLCSYLIGKEVKKSLEEIEADKSLTKSTF